MAKPADTVKVDSDEKLPIGADDQDFDSEKSQLNDEAIVTSGQDVSLFVVDVRDDGDSALTFRSLFLGTVIAGLGAALCQASRCLLYDVFSGNSCALFRSTTSSRFR